jgi:hypothetical protein
MLSRCHLPSFTISIEPYWYSSPLHIYRALQRSSTDAQVQEAARLFSTTVDRASYGDTNAGTSPPTAPDSPFHLEQQIIGQGLLLYAPDHTQRLRPLNHRSEPQLSTTAMPWPLPSSPTSSSQIPLRYPSNNRGFSSGDPRPHGMHSSPFRRSGDHAGPEPPAPR